MKKIATVTIATAESLQLDLRIMTHMQRKIMDITLMTQLHIATLIQLINKVTIIIHGKVIGVLIV